MRTELITDPSAWTGADVLEDPSWKLELSSAEVTALNRALDGVAGRELTAITAATFPLPELAETIARIRAQLRTGRGFAVLSGVPTDHSLDDLERLYWGLLTHIGTGVTQNSDSTLIHYVTDGKLRPNQGTRGVGDPGHVGLHVDLADYVSLLCVRQAADNPPSWLASSPQIHNEVLEHHPEVLPVLYEGFAWSRQGEHGAHDDPVSAYRVPLFSEAGGLVSCRYNRHWMQLATTQGGGRWTDDQIAALDLVDQIARRNRLDVDFGEGDIQFVNNYTVLHGRRKHDLEPDEGRKRLLMRIWVDDDDAPRPTADEAIVRYGVIRHGNLGWSAAEVEAGLVGTARARRPDGAVALS